MTKLVYSYNNGKWWSPHNHKRAFENGTRVILVRDKMGNISEPRSVVINNYMYKEYDYFNIDATTLSDGLPYSGRWTNDNIRIDFPPLTSDADYYTSSSYTGPWVKIDGSPIEVAVGTTTRYYKVIDNYGNQSPITAIDIKIDKDIPVNFNVAVIAKSRRIKVAVTAADNLSGIAGYSVSIDNGSNWTPVQIGSYFVFGGLTAGTYNVKARAYDKAGNYVESATQTYTI